MRERSVAVIGAGVVGLCTAYALQERGFRVTVVDRNGPERDGCSFGNAGMVVPSHFIPLAAPGMVAYGLRMLPDPESPFALRPRLSGDLLRWAWLFHRSSTREHVLRASPVLRDLGLASRRAYEQLADDIGDGFGLTKRGLLMFCKTPATLREETEVAHAARTLGMEAEVLTPDQAHALDPTLRLDVAGAVYFPQDCHLDPNRLMAVLVRRLTDRGARFEWNRQVTGWRRDDGKVDAVKATDGTISADEFVVAGGSWSAEMLRPLGLRLPLQPGRGYSVTLDRPAALPEFCSILVEARVAVTPMGGSLRFAGTMELGVGDGPPDPRRVRGMARSIPGYFPDFTEADFLDQPVWSGLRPCSPDGLPYIGRVPRWGNVTVATGHAMMGVSLAPVTGSLVASVLSGEKPTLDLSLLRPERFG